MITTFEQRGMEKGRREGVREAKVETARNMLKERMDIEVISRITGLSRVELKKLHPTMNPEP